MDILGLVIFISLIVFTSSLLIVASKLYVENKNNKAIVEQLTIDKEYLKLELSAALADIENRKLENDESFVRFLSTSREWAYGYIEKVQAEMLKFDKEVSPILDWNEKFGDVAGETTGSKGVSSIAKAYKDLKELMPEGPQEDQTTHKDL
jgi:hypothetical protein